MSDEKLPLRIKMGYGVCDLGGNLFFTVIGFLLMNYITDEAGLAAGLAGAALMIGRLVDAVSDPLVGYFSDRTKSRWGRRRPWILFGSIPLGVAAFWMFRNPHITDQTALFIWIAASFVVLCVLYACVNIPYNALTPELTKDFNERTSLNGYRMMFAVVGTLTGVGAAMPIVSAFSNRTYGFMAAGAVFGIIITVTALITFFSVKEKTDLPIEQHTNVFSSYFEALKNKPFLCILIPWTSTTIGVTIVLASLTYYFKYVLCDEKALTIALLIMIVTAMLFIPVCVKVAKKVPKNITYMCGMIILSAVVTIIFFFGHIFGTGFVYPLMIIGGIGLSTNYVMPWSIIPDTIEYDYAHSGVRREGIYYGLWIFMIKVGQGFANFIVGLILMKSDFVANAVQSASAIMGIRLLIGPCTLIFFIISIIVLWFYPINNARYAEIREEIRIMEEKKI
ncbi:MAG: MFS transporter [Spirochaetota bacterium]